MSASTGTFWRPDKATRSALRRGDKAFRMYQQRLLELGDERRRQRRRGVAEGPSPVEETLADDVREACEV